MKYCKKCLTTDLRPNAKMEDGICIPCKYTSKSKEENYDIKLKILQDKIKEVLKKKKPNSPTYDCIIGVSGGKDSTRQAHWVRDRLGLKPLLVCVAYPPKQMSQTGANNIANLIEMGFDIITTTPAPKSSEQLMLDSLQKFGNLLKATEMCLFSSVPRIAIELNINLIFWGENPALQVGDSASLGFDEFDANNLRNMNTLSNGGIDWIDKSIREPHLKDHYIYPSSEDFVKNKINIFYLGPAWDDWSDRDNATYASLQGLHLRPGQEDETGDLLNASAVDEDFVTINMMLRYYKFGLGKATDFVCSKIRDNSMSREEAIKIVEKYDGVCSQKTIDKFCKYVNISQIEFWDIVNKWVNQDIFQITPGQKPIKKFQVGVDYDC